MTCAGLLPDSGELLGMFPCCLYSESTLRKPLAFHSVSFGQDSQSHYLRRMAQIAAEVYKDGPVDPLAPAGVNPCSFNSVLDTVGGS